MDRKAMMALFFSVYFLFYAVLPLTYAIRGEKTDEFRIQYPSDANPQSARDLRRETVGESFARGNKSDHDGATRTILIKKKRALVPEDDTARLVSNTAIIPIAGHVLPAPDSVARFIDTEAPLNLYAGSHPICAGRAPPSI